MLHSVKNASVVQPANLMPTTASFLGHKSDREGGGNSIQFQGQEFVELSLHSSLCLHGTFLSVCEQAII
jgi:hypothetical protein